MSAKTITAPPPNFAEPSPLVRHFHTFMRLAVKRFSAAASSSERVLTIEDRVAIGAKKSLMVVRCHGQHFLVAIAGDTVGPLIEIAAPKSTRRARREREA